MSRETHSVYVSNPQEMRMGSPQYGELVLDDQPMPDAQSIEFQSLTWSHDGRMLAAQELVSWVDGPETRVVVFDTVKRVRVAASSPHHGLCDPVRFEADQLVYRHWHHRRGERELRLPL
jgi:hypothetical protein